MAIPCGRYTQQVLEGHGLLLTEDCHKSNSYKYHQQRTGWGLISLNYRPKGTPNSPPPSAATSGPAPAPAPEWSAGINFPAGINQGIVAHNGGKF